MRTDKFLRRGLIVALFLALAICITTIKLSRRAQEEFPVRGVDVSAYQGYIDWQEIEREGIDFAFVKASEGSSYRDKRARDNLENIKATDIAAGAYHFLSFESDGASQARNFISVVEPSDISLPPVIDLELYGRYNNEPPSDELVREILDGMIPRLYEVYGKYPIIYTNRRAYSLYVSGDYRECDIWICDTVKKPALPDGREWTFWQYSHEGVLSGYDGEEEYIDLDVFNGSRRDFRQYIK